MSQIRARLLAVAAALTLVACAYQPPVETFAEQRLTWFSYLAADDIRASCGPGQADHLRLVYNAGSGDRTRAYDLVALPDGSAVLDQRVDRGLQVSRFQLDESLLTLGAPVRATTRVSPEAYQDLRRALADSGVFEPPPVGLTLRANRFYWLVTGCSGGQWVTTGFRHPSTAFHDLAFPAILARLDATGVRFITPEQLVGLDGRRCAGGNRGREPRFCSAVTIGADGLVAL